MAAFNAFADELRDDLNDSISDEEVIEMLAQHLITKPVFDALFKDYKQYLNQYWRAGEQLMTNYQNGKSTALLWEDYQFGMGLTDRDFDKNTLKRAR